VKLEATYRSETTYKIVVRYHSENHSLGLQGSSKDHIPQCNKNSTYNNPVSDLSHTPGRLSIVVDGNEL